MDYEQEITTIKDYLLEVGDEELLGKFIYDTFRESFGSRFFKCDEDECEIVGRRMRV